jgi:hypothetical protein
MLAPHEKETSLNLLGGAEVWEVESYAPSAIRGLLAQPEFEETERIVRQIRGRDVVVCIRGRLPLGAVKIGRPRRDARLSRVFARRAARTETLNLRLRGTDLPSRAGGEPWR